MVIHKYNPQAEIIFLIAQNIKDHIRPCEFLFGFIRCTHHSKHLARSHMAITRPHMV